MGILVAILIWAGVVLAYVMIERRVSLRPCSECGFRVSIDGLDEDCPRCGSLIREHR